MNSVKIIVKSGEGREVNPFQMSNANPMAGMNNFESYHHFEDNVKPYPAPGIKDGTHMARLQWQAYAIGRNDWYDLPESEWKRLKKYEKTRQVWVLSPDGEGEKDTQKAQSVEEAAKKAISNLKLDPNTYFGIQYQAYFIAGAQWQQSQSDLVSKAEIINKLQALKDFHHNEGNSMSYIAIGEAIEKVKELK